MHTLKYAFLLLLFISIEIFSQTGWVLQTINPVMDIDFLSYKDTNISQLAVTKFGSTSPKVIVSTDGTNTWQVIDHFAYSYRDIQFIDAHTGFILDWQTSYIQLERSFSSGLSWGVVHTFPGNTLAYTVMYFADVNTGFLWGEDPPIKTTNGGINWVPASFSPLTNYTYMYFVNPDTGFIFGTHSSVNCIAKTTNQGDNWEVTDIPVPAKQIQFAGLNTGCAMCSNSIFLKTTNLGQTWISISITPAENLISMSLVDSNNYYFLTQSGKIVKTTDGGNNFSSQILPASGSSVRLVEFASVNRGIVLLSGGKILKTTTGGEVISVQQSGEKIPEKYSLSQNFPNPFNPSTQIRFDIPKSTLVKLVVYDALGREIEQLVNQELNPGCYKYDWSAEGGAISYPSGIYFYKLEAGDYSETKKMVLIK